MKHWCLPRVSYHRSTVAHSTYLAPLSPLPLTPRHPFRPNSSLTRPVLPPDRHSIGALLLRRNHAIRLYAEKILPHVGRLLGSKSETTYIEQTGKDLRHENRLLTLASLFLTTPGCDLTHTSIITNTPPPASAILQMICTPRTNLRKRKTMPRTSQKAQKFSFDSCRGRRYRN